MLLVITSLHSVNDINSFLFEIIQFEGCLAGGYRKRSQRHCTNYIISTLETVVLDHLNPNN